LARLSLVDKEKAFVAIPGTWGGGSPQSLEVG
jgi:hypothetical protein